MLTEQWIDRLSYRDVRMQDVRSLPPLTTICSKILIYLVFDKSVTDRWTDGPTNRRTDRPRDVSNKFGQLIDASFRPIFST